MEALLEELLGVSEAEEPATEGDRHWSSRARRASMQKLLLRLAAAADILSPGDTLRSLSETGAEYLPLDSSSSATIDIEPSGCDWVRGGRPRISGCPRTGGRGAQVDGDRCTRRAKYRYGYLRTKTREKKRKKKNETKKAAAAAAEERRRASGSVRVRAAGKWRWPRAGREYASLFSVDVDCDSSARYPQHFRDGPASTEGDVDGERGGAARRPEKSAREKQRKRRNESKGRRRRAKDGEKERERERVRERKRESESERGRERKEAAKKRNGRKIFGGCCCCCAAYLYGGERSNRGKRIIGYTSRGECRHRRGAAGTEGGAAGERAKRNERKPKEGGGRRGGGCKL